MITCKPTPTPTVIQTLASGVFATLGLGLGLVLFPYAPCAAATATNIIAAGAYHSLYVTSDGTLYGMGSNSYDHSLYVTTDGHLCAMGWNTYGQLGDGTTTTRLTPVVVASNVGDGGKNGDGNGGGGGNDDGAGSNSGSGGSNGGGGGAPSYLWLIASVMLTVMRTLKKSHARI